MKVGAVSSITETKYPLSSAKITQGNNLPVKNELNCLPLKGYYPANNISFGRLLSEHQSWGATINKNGSVNFKLFTYPDAKHVYVEIFNTDNPSECKDVKSRPVKPSRSIFSDNFTVKPADRKSTIFELENKGSGIFTTENISTDTTNAYYRYIIVKNSDDIRLVKDPYAKEQPHIMGWSKIHNPNNFKWTDSKWMSGQDNRRITRQASKKTQGINSLRIYEMNIPTITYGGDFSTAINKLKEIKEKNYANAIEIMPVENTYSRQWGYDGVDKFAVNEKLGGSKGLKKFIDKAHELGLSVIIDMVPNHIGPDGDMLSVSGPYSSGPSQFGAKFNYEGRDNRYVRDYVVNMALNWAGEYHVDGLRFDMTNPSVMGSDYALKQIAEEVNEHYPDVFLIAEDGANNRAKITAPIQTSGNHLQDIEEIDRHVHDIENNNYANLETLNALGFDSEWDFPLMRAILNMTEVPNSNDLYALDNNIKNSHHRVAYSISHDEIGNYDGTSSVVKYATRRMNLMNDMQGGDYSEKFQRAAHATHKLLSLYASGKLDKIDDLSYNAMIYNQFKLTRYVSRDEVKAAYDYALKKLKLALGTIYTIPGPKMYFQGAEEGNMAYFKFFREFSDVNSPNRQARENAYRAIESMTREKGYDANYTNAYGDSMQTSIVYGREASNKMSKVGAFTTELNNIAQDNPALQDGEVQGTVLFHNELVQGVHCKKGDNEIFSVKNYSDASYDRFDIQFPEGHWIEIANSDDKKFGGEGKYKNNSVILVSNGKDKTTIKLADNSTGIFKRLPKQ